MIDSSAAKPDANGSLFRLQITIIQTGNPIILGWQRVCSSIHFSTRNNAMTAEGADNGVQS
jgi:hypothetical protein